MPILRPLVVGSFRIFGIMLLTNWLLIVLPVSSWGTVHLKKGFDVTILLRHASTLLGMLSLMSSLFMFQSSSAPTNTDELTISSFLEPSTSSSVSSPEISPAPISQSLQSPPCRICPDSINGPSLIVPPPAVDTALLPVSPPFDPSVRQSVCTHPMTTWARSGIFKPLYIADIATTGLLSALVASSEPKGFKSVIKHPH